MPDKFPRFPSFGEDVDTVFRPAPPKKRPPHLLFWLALACCCLVPITYSTFLFILVTR